MKKMIVAMTVLLLAGCEQSEPVLNDVLIYESANMRQCEPQSGISITDSAAKLRVEGIAVMESFCAELTGVAFPAACGMGTGDIIVHRIAMADIANANLLEFRPVAVLTNEEAGTGYQFINCK